MDFLKDRERNVRIVARKREEMKQLAMVNVQVLRDGLRDAARH
jgi:hypothetical protein